MLVAKEKRLNERLGYGSGDLAPLHPQISTTTTTTAPSMPLIALIDDMSHVFLHFLAAGRLEGIILNGTKRMKRTNSDQLAVFVSNAPVELF